MTLANGTVLNGAVWIDGDSWLITEPNLPIDELLNKQLAEQRKYIERLTVRADNLERYLATKAPASQV